MPAELNLTKQQNPLAQTFRVLEPGGSTISSIGVFFHTAPKATDYQHKLMLELRPVGDQGFPSSSKFWARTKTKASAAQIRAVASTEFSAATEYKFTFPTPLYVPQNTEMAFVLYSAAGAGKYKVWAGSTGDFYYGSTVKRITQQLDAGALFESANGTTWSADQSTDLAFKVYRAKFKHKTSRARFEVNTPPQVKLTENRNSNKLVMKPADPLLFTASSNVVSVLHANHGFQVGDKVVLEDQENDSADVVNGVQVGSYTGQRTITDVDPFGYSFNMDSDATDTTRAGGNDLFASSQISLDEFMVDLSIKHPGNSSALIAGNFTTSKSFAGTETAYNSTGPVPLKNGEIVRLQDPHVIASEENEDFRLSGNASTFVDVYLTTDNEYTAPWINLPSAQIGAASYMVDYQAETTTNGRNTLSTIPFVSETEPDGGTTASKHITVPFVLEQAATSIRVLVDAARPPGSDFSVWYRTVNSDKGKLKKKNWVEMSKSISSPNRSNYSQLGTSVDYQDVKEYEFNAYDLNSFDTYQIKITFNAKNQTQPVIISGLRTLATV